MLCGFSEPHFAVNAETGFQPLLMGFSVYEVPISWINRTPEMGVSSFKLAKVGGGILERARAARQGNPVRHPAIAVDGAGRRSSAPEKRGHRR